MDKIIVAIGGGELRLSETLPIDQKIVELTGKERPKALFIPTASGDAQGYWETFNDVYGKTLGCETDVLFLLKGNLTSGQVKEKIESADLVYVGGGNTLRMMRSWRRLGVDTLLREAYQRGAVLSGLSAGAICWFDHGHSDSQLAGNGSYMRVSGLGLLRGTFCPHYLHERRQEDFAGMIGKYGGFGYGIDNGAALLVRNGEASVLRSLEGSAVVRIEKIRGGITTGDLA
jgi:dipeptidase E